MRHIPQLYTGEMVRQIIARNKRITRRPDKTGKPPCAVGDVIWVRETFKAFRAHGQHRGDGKRWGPWGGLPTVLSPDGTQIAYFREGFDRCESFAWTPSIHMPRWASRLNLLVTDVRLERVQDITDEDALLEGIGPMCNEPAWLREHFPDHMNEVDSTPWGWNEPAGPSWRDRFGKVWASLYGAESWESNAPVWRIAFEVQE